MPNWSAAESPQIITITLNSAADGAKNTGSSVIANGTDKYQFADAFLTLGSITPSGEAAVLPHILPYNGTAYADIGPNSQIGTFFLGSGAGARTALPLWGLLLPDRDFKWAIESRAGVPLAGSGNSLIISRYSTG